MKNIKFTKMILTFGILFSFTLEVNSEIIPVTFSKSPKHLPSSVTSNINGICDGTMICWLDSVNNGSIWIQKINSNGERQWGDNGVTLDTDLGLSFDPVSDYPIVYSDNSGGALVVYGKNFYSSREIYVAKIYFNGIPARSPVCITSYTGGYNYSPVSALTKDGSIVIAWENFFNGDFNIYAQKVDIHGDVIWNNSEEVEVCSESHDQRKPSITCSGNKNAVIAWLDARNSNNYTEFSYDLFAKQLDEDGNYTGNNVKGKLIFSPNDDNQRNSFQKITGLESITSGNERKMIFYNHNLIPSDNNSVILAIDKWHLDIDSDIKIFKITENLDIVWTYNIEARSFQKHPLIMSNNNNGAYVFWNDKRNEVNSIYAIGLDYYGKVIMGSENGIRVSYDNSKDSFERVLPSSMNHSGFNSGRNNIYFSWTTSDNNNLYISSINHFYRTDLSKNAAEVQDNISGGELTSITSQNENVIVVFKKDDNIFVSMKSSDKPVDLKNKINSFNFPNPFNPSTKINFIISLSGNVKLSVYDISGKEIRSLVNEFKAAGSYSVHLDGSSLSSGVYFYKIELNGWIETRKMTLIK